MNIIKISVIDLLFLCTMGCGKGIKIVNEEPVRKIIFYSISLQPIEKGYKPLTMYCDSVGLFTNFENISYVRYGNENNLIENAYYKINDTIQIVYNGRDNIKYNDKLCISYQYYEKIDKNRGWYTLIVCDSIPQKILYSKNNKKTNFDVISYTTYKKATGWNDEYPEYIYFPETDEYLKIELDTSFLSINERINDISKIPKSIIETVPNEYTILCIAYGNLNGDNIDDAAVVLRDINYNQKFQLLIGKSNNTFSQYKTLNFGMFSPALEDDFIKIEDGTLEFFSSNGRSDHTEYFQYCSSDKELYLTELSTTSQVINQSEEYEDIESRTKYVKNISIEDYFKSFE